MNMENNINNLELFLDGLNRDNIDKTNIIEFVNIINTLNKHKKCLIVRYKLDKFVNALDRYVKMEKYNFNITNFYEIITLDIIYFMLVNDYNLFINNFLKQNNEYINNFFNDFENNYKIIDILFKKEFANIIILLIIWLNHKM